MTMPRATYRLQFRNGMTFDRAAELVPHWQALGISHLYASPIFTAVTGSTHGYDLTRYDEIDPDLGGIEGLENLSARLRQAGLGLILDIVPNHMAASMENPWWRSVAEWGEASPYARHFDIDWSRRLTLPLLGSPPEEALSKGEIKLEFDRATKSIVAIYFDHRIPLNPATYAMVLEPAVDSELAERARAARPEDVDGLKERLVAHASILDSELERTSADKAVLHEVLAAQPWQFRFWRDAAKDLSYRRFFEVTGLVGVRVEDPPVFYDAHRLVLDLVRRGIVDGLRVDHVDGLADPTGYLERLRAEIGPDIYLVVEKILEGSERLPESWPVAGTTGYEFIAAIAELAVDGDKSDALDEAYAALLDAPAALAAEERKAKALIVFERLETELNGLARLAEKALDGAFEEARLRDAIAAIAIAFPVYRTYAGDREISNQDRDVLEKVCKTISDTPGEADGPAIEAVLSLISSRQAKETAAFEFVTRFQQMTGPVMAKAIEDTLFYRHNRLIALNEVGGDPAGASGSVERFHEEMKRRLIEQPHGLVATTTHDTKRSEDARARLLAISEFPKEWAEAVTRWRAMNRDAERQLEGGPAPEAETAWLLYQALAGVWPDDLAPDDGSRLEALNDRFQTYVEKALREAKLRTDWISVDADYEDAVKAYAGHLLSPDNQRFLTDFAAFIEPLVEAGRSNTLLQTVIKLTAPGIPDIYQGTEIFDFSLADPDNRRPPDFSLAEAALNDKSVAAGKGWITKRLLALRSRHPDLFTTGDYIPVSARGPAAKHVVAFLRSREDHIALTVGLRLPLGLKRLGQDALQSTHLLLPSTAEGRAWLDASDDAEIDLSDAPSAGALLREQPAAVFFSNISRSIGFEGKGD